MVEIVLTGVSVSSKLDTVHQQQVLVLKPQKVEDSSQSMTVLSEAKMKILYTVAHC